MLEIFEYLYLSFVSGCMRPGQNWFFVPLPEPLIRARYHLAVVYPTGGWLCERARMNKSNRVREKEITIQSDERFRNKMD